ncbi:MAG: hypothetical protein JNM84_11470 [Planctomycetes bacterium]|nr:hypothetical protein [Planctomycetota bacterium]
MTFARTGFELVELTLRRLPLAELVTIDRTNEPAEGALTPTRVEIEDASGRHFLAQHVSMQRTIGGQTGGDWYFDAPLDGFELPSGSYTVRSHDPGLRGSVSDAVVELQGSALQTIRLKCAESIRPCTIEIRLGSEAGPDFYELDLWLHGRNLHWSALKPRIESYFPIGFYEGQLEVFGHGKPQFSFAIEDDVERTRKQLVLEVAEGEVCVR